MSKTYKATTVHSLGCKNVLSPSKQPVVAISMVVDQTSHPVAEYLMCSVIRFMALKLCDIKYCGAVGI